ncbi:MAG: hypothetical protein WCT16_03475 [Candidatus Buchananbacteria bacterium]
MVIFICGAKSGDLESDQRKFDLIEVWLKEQGLDVVNPITFLNDQEVQLRLADKDTDLDRELINRYGDESRRSFIQEFSLVARLVSKCDAIFLEYDWQDDPMSVVEYMFSQYFGLPSLMKINGQLGQVEVNSISLTKTLPSFLPDSAITVLTNGPVQNQGYEEETNFCPDGQDIDADTDLVNNVEDLLASPEQKKTGDWLEIQMNPGGIRRRIEDKDSAKKRQRGK